MLLDELQRIPERPQNTPDYVAEGLAWLFIFGPVVFAVAYLLIATFT